MSWAAELHGGTRASALGAVTCWLSASHKCAAASLCEPAALQVSIAVQQFSFKIQPAPIGSMAPACSADLHRRSPLPFLEQSQS